MKQITVNARVKYADDNLIYLEVEHGGQTCIMTVFDDMPLLQVAALLLEQPIPDPPPLSMQKEFTITYHQEIVTDPETGEQSTINIVDDVQAEPRKPDKAKSDLQAMGNWATWSAIQAVAYIQQNVTDLQSAKLALAKLAELVVYLRDIVVNGGS